MKKVFSRIAALALGAGLMLSGCGKLKNKPADRKTAEKLSAEAVPQPKAAETVKTPAKPAAKPQTAYGSAMAKGRSVDCMNNMRSLSQYLMMCGDCLPTSQREFMQNGCPGEVLRCPAGGDYEFLVKGKVRNAGKVPVLRCPTHGVILYSDGSTAAE